MAKIGTGKNAARELGQGWNISPSVQIPAHSTFTLEDDIASVAFWYQNMPHAKFPPLASRDELEWN